jgi:dienelactone hydrolase
MGERPESPPASDEALCGAALDAVQKNQCDDIQFGATGFCNYYKIHS